MYYLNFEVKKQNTLGPTNIEKNKIIKIIEHYLINLDYDIKHNNIILEEIPSHILAIAELFPYLFNQLYWLNNIHNLIEILNEKILISKSLNKIGISFFGGMADIVFSVYIFYKKTGCYKTFLRDIVNILTIMTYDKMEKITKNSIHEGDYDAVQGLSGVGIALSPFSDIPSVKNILYFIINYFNDLSAEYIWCQKKVPKFYIQGVNVRKDDRNRFPNGYLNLGVAHGIGGPLAFLANMYKEGLIIDSHLKSIQYLCSIFMKYKIVDTKGIINWPTQIDYWNLESGKDVNYYRESRASWCYGNIGILSVLNLVAQSTCDMRLHNFVKDNVINLSQQDNYALNLTSPILCHGYAGVLTMLIVIYKNTNHRDILKKIHEIVKIIIELYDEKNRYGYINSGKILINNQTVIKQQEGHDLLNGAVGTILSLISFLLEDTEWEKHLMIK